METVIIIAILVMSVILHEVAHGVMANRLGDPTARLQGRLTLNPFPHIDPMGSVLLPALLVLTNSPILFGWAKPVPYNPYNLKRGGRFAEALVAGAGPATNILLALIFGVVVRVSEGILSPGALSVAFYVVLINIALACFNLIPIPPLDGSKIIDALLPLTLRMRYARVRAALEVNPLLGFGVVILFVIVFGGAFGSLIFSLASLIAGA